MTERAANRVDRLIGAKVRSRRLDIGMSQEKLAELLGVTFQQVQKYERGVNRIAAGRLYDIAQALDLPVAQFFQGLVNTEEACTPPSSADTLELVRLYSKIQDRATQRRVLDLVRSISADAS